MKVILEGWRCHTREKGKKIMCGGTGKKYEEGRGVTPEKRDRGRGPFRCRPCTIACPGDYVAHRYSASLRKRGRQKKKKRTKQPMKYRGRWKTVRAQEKSERVEKGEKIQGLVRSLKSPWGEGLY